MSPYPRRHSFLTTCLLVATLLGTPGTSSGRFVCLRGMPQAGAACPRCHGEGAAPAGSCCAWVEAAPLSAIHVAVPSLDPPTSAGHVPYAFVTDLAGEPSPDAGTLHPNACPSAGPPFRTAILRL